MNVGLTIRASFEGTTRRYGPHWCTRYILHGRHVAPPFVPPGIITTPAPRPGQTADLRVSARVDTAFLDRSGNGRVTGTVVVGNLGPAESGPFRLLVSSSRPDSARAADLTPSFLTCARTQEGTTCTGPRVARGLELAFPWAIPVSGAGTVTVTFTVQSTTTRDPQGGNDAATVQAELRPEP